MLTQKSDIRSTPPMTSDFKSAKLEGHKSFTGDTGDIYGATTIISFQKA